VENQEIHEKAEILESVQLREESPLHQQVGTLREEQRALERRLQELERTMPRASFAPPRSLNASLNMKSPIRSLEASFASEPDRGRSAGVSKQEAIQALSQLLLSRAAYAKAQK